MNDKLTNLLEQLATKLGTTAEYLWKVLVAQARVSAVTALVVFALTIFYAILVWRTHMKLSKPIGKYDSLYEKNEGNISAMILMVVILAAMFIWSLFGISDMINGFFNPEYWALKEVLKSI